MSTATASPPADRLALSYSEAGRLLSLSARTVWGLVDSGELRAIRVGRSVRVPRAEIERYIASRLSDAIPA